MFMVYNDYAADTAKHHNARPYSIRTPQEHIYLFIFGLSVNPRI